MLRKSLILSAILVLCAVGTADAQLVPGAPVTDWDRARADFTITVLREYNTVINNWRENLGAGDAAGAAAHYTEGGILLVSGAEVVQGRTAIEGFLETMTGRLVEIRTGLTDFVASDQLAYATGPTLYTYRDGTSGTVRSVTGNHLTVLVREGRRWRIRSQVLKFEDATAG